MIGHGVSSRSSHSWAAGRTTFSAKSWTHFWIWSWSSSSCRLNSVMPPKLPGGNLFVHTVDKEAEGDERQHGPGGVGGARPDVGEQADDGDRTDDARQRAHR